MNIRKIEEIVAKIVLRMVFSAFFDILCMLSRVFYMVSLIDTKNPPISHA